MVKSGSISISGNRLTGERKKTVNGKVVSSTPAKSSGSSSSSSKGSSTTLFGSSSSSNAGMSSLSKSQQFSQTLSTISGKQVSVPSGVNTIQNAQSTPTRSQSFQNTVSVSKGAGFSSSSNSSRKSSGSSSGGSSGGSNTKVNSGNISIVGSNTLTQDQLNRQLAQLRDKNLKRYAENQLRQQLKAQGYNYEQRNKIIAQNQAEVNRIKNQYARDVLNARAEQRQVNLRNQEINKNLITSIEANLNKLIEKGEANKISYKYLKNKYPSLSNDNIQTILSQVESTILSQRQKNNLLIPKSNKNNKLDVSEIKKRLNTFSIQPTEFAKSLTTQSLTQTQLNNKINKKANELVKQIKLEVSLTSTQIKDAMNVITLAAPSTNWINRTYNKLETLRKGAINKDKNAQAALIGLAGFAVGGVKSTQELAVGLVSLVSALYKNPQEVYKNIKDTDVRGFGLSFGEKLQRGDPQAWFDFITIASANPVIKLTGTVVTKIFRTLSKLRPSYVKILKDSVKVKGIGDLKIQTVKSGSMGFAKQVKKYSGKTVTAVNTAAEGLTSLIRRSKVIRKKIPGEDKAPKLIKDLLQKWDSGKKLKVNEIITINKYFRTNVAPNITILERSLYVDPAKGFRISRLGIKKDIIEPIANLKDIFKGRFKLFRQNPQVLIFQEAQIGKYPKKIQAIVDKIDKKGIKYKGFEKDLALLTQYQTKLTGKFKAGGSPIFAGGRELEATLAPGELIKRVKKVGFTYIEGKRVDFVTAKVVKPSKILKSKILKAESGKLSKAQVLKTEKELSKLLNRKVKLQTKYLTNDEIRRLTGKVPLLRLSPRGLRIIKILSRSSLKNTKTISRTLKTTKRTTQRASLRTKNLRLKNIKLKDRKLKTNVRVKNKLRTSTNRSRSSSTPIRPISRPIKSISRSPISRPIRSRPRRNISRIDNPNKLKKIIPKLDFSSPKLKNRIATFKAVYRERRYKNRPAGRNNPVITKILTKTTTRNRMSQIVGRLADNSAVRSIKVIPTNISKRKVKDIKTPGILRKFKVNKKGLFVEKPKYTIDSRGEKRELKRFRPIKKRVVKKRIIKRPIKRRIIKRVVKKPIRKPIVKRRIIKKPIRKPIKRVIKRRVIKRKLIKKRVIKRKR